VTSYARTVQGASGEVLPPDEWQPLDDHLVAVARASRAFAAKFGAGDWAWLAGLWHDLGKFHPSFQQMLLDVSQGLAKRMVDHSTAGAIHADRLVGQPLKNTKHRLLTRLPLLLTATVAGHHGGLPDGPGELEARLREREELFEEVREHVAIYFLKPVAKIPPPPPRLALRQSASGQMDPGEWYLRLDLGVRMVFSALVDADRLDAKRVADASVPPPIRSVDEGRSYSSISDLSIVVDRSIDDKVARLRPEGMTPTERRLYDYRQAVLQSCRVAADVSSGAFALDVATGGGKTLSSLSFALRHAAKHRKDRVIVVIPYTSIIEQAAAEYRRALGDLAHNVVEHHSAVNEDHERHDGLPGFDRDAERRRLATENWDAPIIVTTAVQFFESLLSCSPSKCRKLHNIANSVVVMDEAQTLPPGLLDPTIWLINELVEGYGVTAVLSTATQPSLERPFPEIRGLRPIVCKDLPVPPPRVRVELVADGPQEWAALAGHLVAHQAVLCITHQRRDARDLTLECDRILGNTETIHLSASMCAVHRSLLIADVKHRLSEGVTCRVVSTQLVEAGVDLDFPMVYRSLAGIDSLVQAAGRANREGRLGEHGGVLRIYRAPTQPPPGLPRLASESAETLFRAASMLRQQVDIFDRHTGRAFFRDYYGKIGDMDKGIRADRTELKFGSVAQKYRFIDDASIPIVVPWDQNAVDLVAEIDQLGPSSSRLRRVQPYTVSVFPGTLDALRSAGVVEPLIAGDDAAKSRVFVLRLKQYYSERFGLDVGAVAPRPPEDLII